MYVVGTLDVDLVSFTFVVNKPVKVLHNVHLHVSATSDEYELLQRAHACSKEILNYVNQAVRDCENHQKLVNFQRRLDKRSIENSTHPVILEYKVKPPPQSTSHTHTPRHPHTHAHPPRHPRVQGKTPTHPVILEYKVNPPPLSSHPSPLSSSHPPPTPSSSSTR